MTPKEIYNKLPSKVKHILVQAPSSWLVGSAVDNIIAGKTPKDYDIIVTNSKEYFALVREYRDSLVLNTFGGIKITGFEVIDIWFGDLSEYLRESSQINSIYNLPNRKLFLV